LTTEAAIRTVEGVEWKSSIICLEGAPGLVQSSWIFLATLRRRYIQRLQTYRVDLPVIYHDGWGLELFATEDNPRRRFVWVHTPKPFFERFLERCSRYGDAFIFDREEWMLWARKAFTWLPQSRTFTFCGLEGLSNRISLERRSLGGSKCIIGFVDPLKESGARVDRLIQLIERSSTWKCPVEWRIYSDGPYEKQLKALRGVHVTFVSRGPSDIRFCIDCDYLLFCGNELGRPYEMLAAGLDGIIPILPFDEVFGLDSGWHPEGVYGYESGNLDRIEMILTQSSSPEEFSARGQQIQEDIQSMVEAGTREKWLCIEEKLTALSIRRQMQSSPKGLWTYRTYLRIQRLLQGE